MHQERALRGTGRLPRDARDGTGHPLLLRLIEGAQMRETDREDRRFAHVVYAAVCLTEASTCTACRVLAFREGPMRASGPSFASLTFCQFSIG